MKYNQWLDIWLKNYIKPTAKRRTYERYSQVVEQHIIDKLGDEELDDITSLAFLRDTFSQGLFTFENAIFGVIPAGCLPHL